MGVEIIRIKAVLSSAGLAYTGLELSLAITDVVIVKLMTGVVRVKLNITGRLKLQTERVW